MSIIYATGGHQATSVAFSLYKVIYHTPEKLSFLELNFSGARAQQNLTDK
jgi:hypothetical protein